MALATGNRVHMASGRRATFVQRPITPAMRAGVRAVAPRPAVARSRRAARSGAVVVQVCISGPHAWIGLGRGTPPGALLASVLALARVGWYLPAPEVGTSRRAAAPLGAQLHHSAHSCAIRPTCVRSPPRASQANLFARVFRIIKANVDNFTSQFEDPEVRQHRQQGLSHLPLGPQTGW